MRRLRGTITVRDATQAFSYLDSRNVLGFVDGTENPVGGGYALVQKYLHDVDAWEDLAVEAQEITGTLFFVPPPGFLEALPDSRRISMPVR
ncbi:hypothetical protein [Streptomyces sp. NPDC050416]|uniref:hypothetical protein n=1 Tax=Streptomyces sp. NPDC050416 TaxID=3365611 RepID=UPI0037AFEC3B